VIHYARVIKDEKWRNYFMKRLSMGQNICLIERWCFDNMTCIKLYLLCPKHFTLITFLWSHFKSSVSRHNQSEKCCCLFLKQVDELFLLIISKNTHNFFPIDFNNLLAFDIDVTGKNFKYLENADCRWEIVKFCETKMPYKNL